LRGAFDENGRGAVINSSRGILYAYKKEEGCSPEDYAGAARRAVLKMKEQLGEIIGY
jgi:orotidine-5'-phosphate decarboxylase